ncbi:Uncharacterized protein FKW44_008916, partial [Caligus rogercresseyi]
MCIFCLYNPSAFCIDDALDQERKEEQALATRALSNFLDCFIMELMGRPWCCEPVGWCVAQGSPEKIGAIILGLLRQQLANREFVAVATLILIHTVQQSYVRNFQLLDDIPDGPDGVVLED